MTTEQNIRAILECFFSGYKDEIIDSATKRILDINVDESVIRCKDCKWYGRADKSRFYRGMDCLNKRIATIDPDMDYCSRAERRTDE